MKKKAKRASATGSVTKAVVEQDAGPAVIGSEEEYERLIPEARALAAGEVKPFHGDATLAYHNAADGAAAVLTERERVVRELPAVSIARLEALAGRYLGLVYAAAQVDRHAPSSGEVRAMLVRGRVLRDVMLTGAEALGKAGTIALREATRIREGQGPIDTAQDLVDLAALFTRNAARVRGRTAVTAAQISEAKALGTELLRALRPTSAPKPATRAGVREAVDLRDRIGTLLARDADMARRAGLWLWGESSVDTRVPLLQARRAPAKKRAVKKGTGSASGDAGTGGTPTG